MRLVAGRPKSRPVRVGFVVYTALLETVLSQYFCFPPCQYHSTNAPYSFIHLSPTLYNLSNRGRLQIKHVKASGIRQILTCQWIRFKFLFILFNVAVNSSGYTMSNDMFSEKQTGRGEDGSGHDVTGAKSAITWLGPRKKTKFLS